MTTARAWDDSSTRLLLEGLVVPSRRPPRRGHEKQRQPAKEPHAGWGTNLLMLSLARAGWGELAGADARGVRVVLDAIAGKIVDHRTGRAFSTLEEIAAVAGYGRTWTRNKVTDLEAIGVLEWRRGGLRKGRRGGRERSFFVINRAVLVELIQAARRLRAGIIDAHRAEVVRRLAERRRKWRENRLRLQKPRSEQVTLRRRQPPPTEVESAPGVPPGPPERPDDPLRAYFNDLHAQAADDPTCEHGDTPTRCALCRTTRGGAAFGRAQRA